MDRCVAWSYYGPYYEGAADLWNNLVVEPNGSVRETEHFMELYMAFVGGKNLQYLRPASRQRYRTSMNGSRSIRKKYADNQVLPQISSNATNVHKIPGIPRRCARFGDWLVQFQNNSSRHYSALRRRLARESIARFGLQDSGIRTL